MRVALFVAAALLSPDSGALSIFGYTAPRHDRFASGYPADPVPNPAFFAGGYDWSGVGWDSANSGRSVALISPQHFVCANHYRPTGSIVFRNRQGVLETYTVQGFYNTQTDYAGTPYTSDLCVGKLSQPVSKDVTYYAVPTPASLDWFLDRQLHVYGLTARVGTNVVSSRATSSQTWCVAERKDAIADESHFQSGDSGGPSFLVVNGSLAVVGTHVSVDFVTSYDSLIAAYVSQLNTCMGPSYSVATVDPAGAAPTVQFTVPMQASAEGDGQAIVTAQLSAAASATVTIPLAVSGTATSGDDFAMSAAAIVIPAGQLSASVVLSICEDADPESDETVVVTLWTPSNAVRGTVFEHTVVLADNDGITVPGASFAASSLSHSESAGTVTVMVELSDPATSPVSIPFAVSGTATAGATADYTITASPITIAAGERSGAITIAIHDDGEDEYAETIVLTMGEPTGASRGAVTEHTATIEDNDLPPPGSFNVDNDVGSDFRDVVLCSRCVAGLAAVVPPGMELPAGETEATVRARIEGLLTVRPDGFAGLDVDRSGVVVLEDIHFINRRMAGHLNTVPDGTALPAGVTEADVNARIDALLAP